MDKYELIEVLRAAADGIAGAGKWQPFGNLCAVC